MAPEAVGRVIPALVSVLALFGGGVPAGLPAPWAGEVPPDPSAALGTDPRAIPGPRWPPLADPRRLEAGRGPIYSLSWSPDGEALAWTDGRQVKLWRPGTDRPLGTFAGHTGSVTGVAWSPGGTLVASAGRDGTVRLWSSETGTESAALETGPALCATWSPDGTRVAVGTESGKVQIWEAVSGELLHSAPTHSPVIGIDWSPDGRRVAAGHQSGLISFWDAEAGGLLATLMGTREGRSDANGVAWSPDGAILASAHGGPEGQDSNVRLWDGAAAQHLRTLSGEGGWLRGIAWSPGGGWLAAAGQEGEVRIWSVATRRLVARLPTGPHEVRSVAWSPDGRLLAAGAGSEGSRSGAVAVFVWEVPGEIAAAERPATPPARPPAVAEEAPPPAPKPRSEAEFRDGGAYGVLTRVELPFGNLETSFVESDLRSLGIAQGTSFRLRCRGKEFEVFLGEDFGDVPRGGWVALFSLEGTLKVARHFASAAEASGCEAGDSVFVSQRSRPE